MKVACFPIHPHFYRFLGQGRTRALHSFHNALSLVLSLAKDARNGSGTTKPAISHATAMVIPPYEIHISIHRKPKVQFFLNVGPAPSFRNEIHRWDGKHALA